jgi:hypothetical protein
MKNDMTAILELEALSSSALQSACHKLSEPRGSSNHFPFRTVQVLWLLRRGRLAARLRGARL